MVEEHFYLYNIYLPWLSFLLNKLILTIQGFAACNIYFSLISGCNRILLKVHENDKMQPKE